jgi:hypothetical protein
MPLPAIRLDIDEPLDMHGGILAEIAFHIALLFDHLADAIDFVFAQILNLLEWIDRRLAQNLQRPRITDPENVRQPDPCLLVARQIDACNTCHTVPFVPRNFRSGYSGRISYRSF